MSISRRGFLGLCTKAVAAAALIPVALRKPPAPTNFVLRDSSLRKKWSRDAIPQFAAKPQYPDVIQFDQMGASRDLRSSKLAQWWSDEMDRIAFEAMSGRRV